MNDEFLYRLRVDPRPQFATQLRIRLALQEETPMSIFRSRIVRVFAAVLLIGGAAYAVTSSPTCERLAAAALNFIGVQEQAAPASVASDPEGASNAAVNPDSTLHEGSHAAPARTADAGNAVRQMTSAAPAEEILSDEIEFSSTTPMVIALNSFVADAGSGVWNRNAAIQVLATVDGVAMESFNANGARARAVRVGPAGRDETKRDWRKDFTAERRDDAWAQETEPQIRGAVENQFVSRGLDPSLIEFSKVECRQTLCEVQAIGYRELRDNPQLDFQFLAPRLVSQELSSVFGTMSGKMGTLPDGRLKYTMFFQRK